MRLRKLSRRMCDGILVGLLVVGIVTYALWPQPQFSFLRGHRPFRDDDRTCAYELVGDPAEFSRRIESELTGQGFKRMAEERWSQGRKVEYQSADEMMQVFLVCDADQSLVSFWILSLREPSRLSMVISDVWSLLTHHHCRGSPKYACIANLKLLEGAQETWAIENPLRTNQIPSDAALFGPQAYIRVRPECPEGGRYTFGKVGEHPHCSIPWHSLQ